MRQPIIAANWKMNKTIAEGESFAQALPVDEPLYAKVEVVVCPPFTALKAVGQGLKGKGVKLGGQNLYPAPVGAFTGEISPVMLRDTGCTYVILGHSERRQLLGEKDEWINLKVKAALAYDLVPLLCIGETLAEREAGRTLEVCQAQLSKGLKGIPLEMMEKIVLAYEPIWAIGTGVHASFVEAEETIAALRRWLSEKWGTERGEVMRIQYGGSVQPENIKEFMNCPNIDGALVGGASLEATSFYQIVRNAGEGQA